MQRQRRRNDDNLDDYDDDYDACLFDCYIHFSTQIMWQTKTTKPMRHNISELQHCVWVFAEQDHIICAFNTFFFIFLHFSSRQRQNHLIPYSINLKCDENNLFRIILHNLFENHFLLQMLHFSESGKLSKIRMDTDFRWIFLIFCSDFSVFGKRTDNFSLL